MLKVVGEMSDLNSYIAVWRSNSSDYSCLCLTVVTSERYNSMTKRLSPGPTAAWSTRGARVHRRFK